MKVATDRMVLLQAKALFEPIHRLRIGIGKRSATVCEVLTASGHLIVKTNTGGGDDASSEDEREELSRIFGGGRHRAYARALGVGAKLLPPA
jgi:hypothetical protein